MIHLFLEGRYYYCPSIHHKFRSNESVGVWEPGTSVTFFAKWWVLQSHFGSHDSPTRQCRRCSKINEQQGLWCSMCIFPRTVCSNSRFCFHQLFSVNVRMLFSTSSFTIVWFLSLDRFGPQWRNHRWGSSGQSTIRFFRDIEKKKNDTTQDATQDATAQSQDYLRWR